MASGPAEGAPTAPRSWLGRQYLIGAYGAFAAYATVRAQAISSLDQSLLTRANQASSSGLVDDLLLHFPGAGG